MSDGFTDECGTRKRPALQVKEVAHLKNCEIPTDDSEGGVA